MCFDSFSQSGKEKIREGGVEGGVEGGRKEGRRQGGRAAGTKNINRWRGKAKGNGRPRQTAIKLTHNK